MRFLNKKGVSLLEILISSAIGAVALVAALDFFTVMVKNQKVALEMQTNESTREIVREALTSRTSSAIQQDIYLDDGIMNFWNLGSALDLTPVAAGPLGSILSVPGYVVSDANTFVATTQRLNLLLLFMKDTSVPSLTLSSSINFPSGPSTANLAVTGSTVGYHFKDTIGVSSPNGVEFMTVTGDPSAGILPIATHYNSLPGVFLPGNTEIYRVKVQAIAVDKRQKTMRILQVGAGGVLTPLSSFPLAGIKLFTAQRLVNPSILTTWADVGKTILRPHAGQNVLRIQWKRPSASDPNALTLLEVPL